MFISPAEFVTTSKRSLKTSSISIYFPPFLFIIIFFISFQFFSCFSGHLRKKCLLLGNWGSGRKRKFFFEIFFRCSENDAIGRVPSTSNNFVFVLVNFWLGCSIYFWGRFKILHLGKSIFIEIVEIPINNCIFL